MATMHKQAEGRKGTAPKTGAQRNGKDPRVKAEIVAAARPLKPKLIRDGFTIPEVEYLALSELKMRAIGLKRPAKKSELLRAGIMALSRMSDRSLLSALAAVPPLKTGRPKN
jgi:hypothetical protein